MTTWLCVLVQTPAHSALGPVLTYRSHRPLPPGTLVRVPLGAREVLGVVWDCPATAPDGLTPAQTKAVAGMLDGLLLQGGNDIAAGVEADFGFSKGLPHEQ